MGYLFLILTILVETGAVTFMKLSNGFHNKLYGSIALACYALGFYLLTSTFKYLPIGLANAIWAGSSTLIVALIGLFYFKEQLSWSQVFFLVLIVIGLIGMNYSNTSSETIL